MVQSKRVRAMVRVVMDVESDSVWGSETTWDQIATQAEDGVRGMFLNGNPLAMKDIPHRIKSLEVVEVRVTPEARKP